MKLIFFIKSSTIDINRYTIKDLTGSTGRLDVIARCILSALITEEGFEKDVQIWTFLDKYGTYIFNSESLNYEDFPKNELLLTDYIVKLLQKDNSIVDKQANPLNSVSFSNKNIFEALNDFKDLSYNIFIMSEEGENFSNKIKELKSKENLLFIMGDQSGDVLDSKELIKLNFPSLSLGTQSYLASSVIRLIKLNLLNLI